MRTRYSFSSRRTRKTKNIRKQRKKYPDVLQEIVGSSDIILEVLDARFIEETRNLEIENKIKNKKKILIYILNKSDLIYKLKKKDMSKLIPNVLVSCTKRRGIKELRDLIKKESRKLNKSLEKKYDKILVGVIGYPNTGKSSLINLLVGKSVAGTGAEAGFTRGLQKLKLNQDIHLLDSPGVIPKKEYSSIKNEALAKHTIVGGRSFSQIKNPEMVIDVIMKKFPDVLEKHYKVKSNGDAEILLEKLGKKLNYLKKGGVVDEDKTARKILKEWQIGKIRV